MKNQFEDRQNRLFGRDVDIRRLTDRCRFRGLTAVVGRPLMGKTWTLQEVGRQLLAENRFLVGYHEAKGGESSHLSYAVADLYTRWLEDSSMREQALSLWTRHKADLLPRVGTMVGTLFDRLLGPQLPDGIGSLMRDAFDGLAAARRDLQSGGLLLPSLVYEEALSLVRLVAKVSGRNIVLTLDAWDKSQAIESEFTMLESYLQHQEEWPQVHLLLAIRDPTFESGDGGDAALQRARNLDRLDPTVTIYELPPMQLESVEHKSRLLAYLRQRVPAARVETDEQLLKLINGYPGVIAFWTKRTPDAVLTTPDDLRTEAENAHTLRYLDLDRMLERMSVSERVVAARLAFLPRLDEENWHSFRPLVLKEQSMDMIHTLIDRSVLADERFPTYGHDTRHVAARRWFVDNQRPMFRRVAEELLVSLASRVTDDYRASIPFIGALLMSAHTAERAEISKPLQVLTCAAYALGINFTVAFAPRFDEWYPIVVKQHESVVTLIGHVLINRGGVRSTHGGESIAEAKRGIADFDAALALPAISDRTRASARYNRGLTNVQLKEFDQALDDFSAVIESPGSTSEQKAKSLYNRAFARQQLRDIDGKVADYTAVIAMADAPRKLVAEALLQRLIQLALDNDAAGAAADIAALEHMPDAPADVIEQALMLKKVIEYFSNRDP